LTELERARAHQESADPQKGRFGFTAYKGEEVKRRLEKLFYGKCAYCETFYASGAPVDIEHFRPKGAIKGEDHPGYWWIAMSWENLLPSCIDCNRKRKQVTPVTSDSLLALHDASTAPGSTQLVLSGKQDSFPIQGVRALPEASDFADERPLLLNPCQDDPAEHLEFYFEETRPLALVLPKAIATMAGQSGLAETTGAAIALASERSVRGAMSIQVYGLNRLGLVQDRTRVLRRLEFLGSLINDLGGMADELEFRLVEAMGLEEVAAIVKRLRLLMDRSLTEMREMASPEAPYSTMAAEWIRRFLEKLDEIGVPALPGDG
jgi:hypothetical protein